MSELLLKPELGVPKSLIEVEAEFLILQDKRKEYEKDSDMYNAYTDAIDTVLVEAAEADPKLRWAGEIGHLLTPTYWKPENKKKGLLK